MRWRCKSRPKVGDERISIKFLILPLRIGDERRWLEAAKVRSVYKSYAGDDSYGNTIELSLCSHEEFLPYDPVKDCDIYKAAGCAHVDGMICDIEACEEVNNRKM